MIASLVIYHSNIDVCIRLVFDVGQHILVSFDKVELWLNKILFGVFI